ncbi:MAG: Panacea domain-containing protein [Limisphaerales bacterium]
MFDVADYFLAQQNAEAGDLISNLKLQKLLYYAQGLHVASEKRPLFADKIHAWKHGPVVPSVYHKFKKFGCKSLPLPKGFDPLVIPVRARKFLDEVYKVYGQFSAWKLREMTHEEPPFLAAASDNGEITLASMAEYFRQYVTR